MAAETGTPQTNLTGHLLIAMPGMGDPRFEHSVVFICDHSDEGAMGLIVNKPSDDVDMPTLLSQLNIDQVSDLSERSVHFGGPVEMGRGFVLHTPDYHSVVTTLEVRDDIHMTATLDILEDLARGEGPQKWMMMLGYAGWAAGQLEGEIAENGWLVCDAAPELIFEMADMDKWEAALKTLGVAALALSSAGGRA
ncbi:MULTISPECIES: YqgE/AlgH family protein [unclassified Mameliella]|uniref:YqgE/AlgH family protein n=1 Tax=unclassified Mameliella TaxID=2630630 RepID=UPI00273F5C57|nr:MULTISPECIES: YqgE/AlgH family protein [unclassified Mameliella]